MTSEGMLLGGAAVGLGIGVMLAFYAVWYVLQAIADWRILSKAGKPGWHSLIPILNVYSEYDICWSGIMGIIFLAATVASSSLSQSESGTAGFIGWILSVAALVIHIIQSVKLSRSFGKGVGFGIFLIILGPVARLVLGFGSSRYVGRR